MTAVADKASYELGEVNPKGRWIEKWDSEDQQFWEARGKFIAKRNLTFSIVAEHIGFSVWLLWSIVVVKMYGTAENPGAHGWTLSATQGLTLLAIASGVGAALRIPYTFAVPKFGGRNWTVISALLLLIPTLGLAWVVQHPEVNFGILVLVAATAGAGGGNFASSMTNITYFYPEREKGWALGLNAAGGNIGVAVAQKVVPFVIGLGAWGLSNAGLLYVPLALASALLAFMFMDNLREAKTTTKPTVDSTKHGHTWIMSFLYIGTFGSFIGYSVAFPSLLKIVFERGDIALTWGFLGALVGSLARPYGGKLADKFGGAKITLYSFAAMTVAGYTAIAGVQDKDLPVFFLSFMFLFVATGIGNGSTYRMAPSIFTRMALDMGAAKDKGVALDYKRQGAAAIGIISSMGAFGGFFIPLIYAWSKSASGTIVPALQAYVVVFIVMGVVTWFVYIRKNARMAGV